VSIKQGKYKFAVIAGTLIWALPCPALANSELKTLCSTPAKPGQEQGMKAENCKAAQDAQKGADTNSALYKVWGGVAAVCTTTCAQSLGGAAPNATLCTGSSLAGAGTEAAYTKNFMSAVGPAAATGQSYVTSQQAANNGAQQGAQNQRDLSPCFSAATATQSAMTKYSSMKSNEKTVASSIQSVKDAKSTTDTPSIDSGGQKPELSAAEAGDSSGGDGSQSGNSFSGTSPEEACSRAKSTRSTSDTIQCAALSDPTLPRFVAQPQFQNEFKKSTGMNFADFVASDDSPAKPITAAAGNTSGAGSAAKLASLLERGDNAGHGPASPEYELASTYSGGGSGNGGGSGSEDAALGEMLAGLMAQLNPEAAEDAKRVEGVKAVIFANKSRSPASVAEDKALNIFDRVTYRYYFIGQRILAEGSAGGGKL